MAADPARPDAFEPNGIITLTTDIGHKGPFVASMKGVMLTRLPTVRIVDLTHNIVEHWPAEAGFWLERSFRYFPKGTVHLALVDPGVGTGRDILGAELDGHAFLAPDNGLLTPMLEAHPQAKVHTLQSTRLSKFGIDDYSATFHGRDIFAPLAAEIASGRVRVPQIGPPAAELIPSWIDDPQVTDAEVRGLVITVDNFGNLITNIDGAHLDRWKDVEVRVTGHSVPLKRTYGDVRPGDYLALVNSYGVLEVAQAQGNAAEGLSVERGAPVVARRL